MTYEIHTGNSLRILPTLPEDYFHCVITSPPYWQKRDYEGEDEQLGAGKTPGKYIDNLVAIMKEVKRVLRDDGTIWVNIADTYASDIKGTGGNVENHVQQSNKGSRFRGREVEHGLKNKDLIGIPWTFAFRMRDELGLYLRNEIVWNKTNTMPDGSARDRFTVASESVFLFSKKSRYYFDWWAVREKAIGNRWGGKNRGNIEKYKGEYRGLGRMRDMQPEMRMRRNVWSIPTRGSEIPHYAMYPEDLVIPCVRAGTSEKGCCPICGAPIERILVDDNTAGWKPTCKHEVSSPVPCRVLDPFSGGGTTGIVSVRAGCDYTGIELCEKYAKISKELIEKEAIKTRLF